MSQYTKPKQDDLEMDFPDQRMSGSMCKADKCGTHQPLEDLLYMETTQSRSTEMAFKELQDAEMRIDCRLGFLLAFQ